MSASPNAHTMNPHVTQSLGQLVAAEGALEESGQVLQVTVTDVDGVDSRSPDRCGGSAAPRDPCTV